MRDQKLSQSEDLVNGVVTFLGINLVWIFLVVWMLYGMVPVLVLAVLINHAISRFEFHQS
ncbi:histidinol phosphate aminotransferase [Parasedimentitalea maritima]|uniref:Histidinol phosphate aminotransferase n=1 Tax=Parasedimentitalea maritima TaxID=2578117 RepID=A0A5R8ZPJ8_9RHOB|nr:histidinol phosphate aminotransferase [Zongyanglinia marina]KAE9630451.1 histidinol phosphate aminotransferase [Zongyanglinia marina]TLP67214.1 histidinol phosphate aminotransferase [Zongyanglinia marina]